MDESVGQQALHAPTTFNIKNLPDAGFGLLVSGAPPGGPCDLDWCGSLWDTHLDIFGIVYCAFFEFCFLFYFPVTLPWTNAWLLP